MFNPDEFHKLSETLCEDKNYNEEARYRTAISRIYYSVFLNSYLMLINRGIRFEKIDGFHKQVQSKLKNLDPKIGSKLEKLHYDFRVIADYNIDEKVDFHMVRETFRFAKVITEMIKKKYDQ